MMSTSPHLRHVLLWRAELSQPHARRLPLFVQLCAGQALCQRIWPLAIREKNCRGVTHPGTGPGRRNTSAHPVPRGGESLVFQPVRVDQHQILHRCPHRSDEVRGDRCSLPPEYDILLATPPIKPSRKNLI
jgi:hypothetical protein